MADLDAETLLGMGSDNLCDYPCTHCTNNGQDCVEASFYCPVCHVYYCRSCLQHLCDHGVIGRAQLDKWGQRKAITEEEEKCLLHQNEAIKMFCGNHGKLCCIVCVSLDHRQCTDVKYIPEAAQGIRDRKEFQTVTDDLLKLQGRVDNLLTDRQSKKTTLTKLMQDNIDWVRQYRQKINELLDNLEKQALAKLKMIEKHNDDQLTADIQVCDQMKTEFNKFSTKLKTLNDDEQKTFIQIQKCKTWILEQTVILDDADSIDLFEHLQFVGSPSLEKAIQSYESLGSIRNIPYKLISKQPHSIKQPGEKGACGFYNMCQLPDGNLAVIDYQHDKLKLVDSTFTVVGEYQFSSYPYCVCSLGNNEVAVGLDNKTIQFLSIHDSSLTSTSSFYTEQKCPGIAYHDGHLYTIQQSGGKKVQKYTLSGTLLQTFTKDKAGQPLFSCAEDLIVSDDGTTIHVADSKKGLVSIDNQGNHLATFKPPGVTGVTCVCADKAGNIFVSNNRRVFQLDGEGKWMVQELLHPGVGVGIDLLTIAFDTKNCRLLVAGKSNKVKEFRVSSKVDLIDI